MIQLVIVEEKGEFVLRAADGACYGRFDTKEEAHAAKMDWEVYFES